MSATVKAEATSSPPAPITGALANALGQVGPSPCDKYVCPLRSRCAANELACRSFGHYLDTGKALPPRTLFVNGEPVRNGSHFFLLDEISANHANYVLAHTEAP